MNTHRDGKPVVVCDGCYQPIVNYSPKVHTLSKQTAPWEAPAHACSTKCVHKIKANPPHEQRCKDCNVRVATGALACMNGHPQPVAKRVRGVAVKDAAP